MEYEINYYRILSIKLLNKLNPSKHLGLSKPVEC